MTDLAQSLQKIMNLTALRNDYKDEKDLRLLLDLIAHELIALGVTVNVDIM